MKPRAYLETSVISYLTAWPSRDPIRAADQLVTREWWENRRGDHDLFASDVVSDEVGAGDPVAAPERLAAIAGLPVFVVVDETVQLADDLTSRVPLPEKARLDALHIALASLGDVDFLLTWNCTHIANPMLRHRIEEVIRSSGRVAPTICTPYELLGRS